ncbi:MAG: SAM-dependent methyltransferase [Candidatus Magasanikbacteria bacterium]|jgi:tRNA (adenine37-N6)-methyltransferase|nr:SAM-dependent methyltransferase [Candidatus Magasanikbacteria bacterium]
MSINVIPIGHVRGGRVEATDDNWDKEQAVIELDGLQYQADALAGLADFSHVEVLFQFHQLDSAKIVTSARHPRGRDDWPKVGIFAQRGRARPNRLAVTVCRIIAVDGLSLTVAGLDAIDGTPVLDLKPYLSGFAPRGEIREPDWAMEIMADYW